MKSVKSPMCRRTTTSRSGWKHAGFSQTACVSTSMSTTVSRRGVARPWRERVSVRAKRVRRSARYAEAGSSPRARSRRLAPIARPKNCLSSTVPMIAKLARIRARGRPAGCPPLVDARRGERAVRRAPALRHVRRLPAGEAAGDGPRARAEGALRARSGTPDEAPPAGGAARTARAPARGALRRARRAGQAPRGARARARPGAAEALGSRGDALVHLGHAASRLQDAEQLLVRLAEPERDPEVAGEADAGAVPHEDARAQELLPEGRRVGDLHDQEVRLRRREGVATRSQPLRAERALLEDEPSRLVPVLRVLEGGERRDLTEPVDVVGRAHAVQSVARLRGRHRVAHPEARERRDLRERPEDDEARKAPEEGDAVGILGVVREVAVRLVEHDERRGGARRGQGT